MATVLDLLLQRSMFLNGWEEGGTQIITVVSEPRSGRKTCSQKRPPTGTLIDMYHWKTGSQGTNNNAYTCYWRVADMPQKDRCQCIVASVSAAHSANANISLPISLPNENKDVRMEAEHIVGTAQHLYAGVSVFGFFLTCSKHTSFDFILVNIWL